MSVATHDLLAAVALRINALDGTDAAELQTTYSQRPLADEMFQSSIFPMGDMIAALNWAQGKLAEQIAFSDKRTQHAYLKSLTSPMPSGSDLPNTDASNNPIIGNFGACLDAADITKQLTRKSVPFVQNILSSSNNYLVELYHYALGSGYILHTRGNVKLECYIYNSTNRLDDFIYNENMLLADSLAEAVICGACAMLVRDDEFNEQASRWAGYFKATLDMYPPAIMEEQAA